MERGRDPFILGVRTPPSLVYCPGLGLDPATWIKAGWIDYVAPSDFMWLDYGTRVEDFAALCEGTECGVYPCLNPFAAKWVDHRAINSYATNPVNFNRRVFFSEEHIRGLMKNYHSWGADGMYSFNFCCETIDIPVGYVRRTTWLPRRLLIVVRKTRPISFFRSGDATDRTPAGTKPGERIVSRETIPRERPSHSAWQTETTGNPSMADFAFASTISTIPRGSIWMLTTRPSP